MVWETAVKLCSGNVSELAKATSQKKRRMGRECRALGPVPRAWQYRDHEACYSLGSSFTVEGSVPVW